MRPKEAPTCNPVQYMKTGLSAALQGFVTRFTSATLIYSAAACILLALPTKESYDVSRVIACDVQRLGVSKFLINFELNVRHQEFGDDRHRELAT